MRWCEVWGLVEWMTCGTAGMRIDMKFCRPACSPFKALFSRKAEFANLRCSRGSDAKFVCASLKSATSELVFYNVASCHPNTVAEQSRTGCLARSVTRRCSKRLFKNLRPKAISGDSEEEGAKSDHASSLLDALQQQPLIGSEYGEVAFSPSIKLALSFFVNFGQVNNVEPARISVIWYIQSSLQYWAVRFNIHAKVVRTNIQILRCLLHLHSNAMLKHKYMP